MLILNGSIHEGTLEYFATVNSIYVVYGRPFHRCNGIGLLDESDVPPELIPEHKHMMTFRDKVFGHKDTDGIRIDDHYTANEVRAVVGTDGQMRVFCTEFYTRPPKMSNIRTHAHELCGHFEKRIKEIMAALLPGGRMADGTYIYDGEFMLSIDFREALPFKRIPDQDAYVYRNK